MFKFKFVSDVRTPKTRFFMYMLLNDFTVICRYQCSNQRTEKPKIYNYVSSIESPLTWGEYIDEMYFNYCEAPPLQAMWYPMYVLYVNLWVGTILRFFLHRVPAVCMDCLLIVSGKSPK